MYTASHCMKPGCLCTHTHGCERGWIWKEYDDQVVYIDRQGKRSTKTIKREGVVPCMNCDSERYEIWLTALTYEDYIEKLQKRGYGKKKAYENEENSKTRVL